MAHSAAVARLDPAPSAKATLCTHPHVHPHLPALRRGSGDGARPTGYHVAQGGVCDACRRPMLRVVELPAGGPAVAGAWTPVAGAPPLPRRRRAA